MRTALTSGQAVALEPVNAWLVVGDAAAYPSERDLAAMGAQEVSSWIWTVPAQARPGDLLLFYFTAPIKEVRFAARVSSRPFSEQDIFAQEVLDADPTRTWVTHTPLVEVPPVSFQALSVAMQSRFSLRGKPQRYLVPDVVRALVETMEHQLDAALGPVQREILVVPTGDPLPDGPELLDLDGWRSVAPGSLKTVADVRRWVVEPLLRLALPEACTIVRRHLVPGVGVADYAVLRDGAVLTLVLATVGLARPQDDCWSSREAYLRLEHILRRLGVPGLLVEANHVLMLTPDSLVPADELDRVVASDIDLKTLVENLGA